jgi:flagellar FliL protein
MADAASDSKKSLMTTAIVILLLTLMGAGVGFAVGVFLKPGDDAKTAETPADAIGQETPSPDSHAEGKPDASSHGDSSSHAEAADGSDQHGEHEDVDVPEDEQPLSPKDLTVVAFSPVLTTLGSPKDKWIRLEGSILVKTSTEIPHEQLSEQAGEQILSYLRTADLAQIEGPSGFLALRYDLNETLRTLSKGDINGILIHGLVVE